MPVYEGILSKVSSGQVITSAPRTVRTTVSPFGIARSKGEGYARQAGFTRREFIQVGDARITQVMLHAVLRLAPRGSGRQVRRGQHRQDRPQEHRDCDADAGRRTGQARTREADPDGIWLVLRTWFVAVIFGAILTLILAAFLGNAGIAIGVLLTLAFALWPFLHFWRTFRARTALDAVPLPEEAVTAG